MKLTRWKLVYIFLFIFLIFQTNMVLANNIVVPHEWYRYQGTSDSDNKGHDCGPACVAMAIQFIKNTIVPIRDIRNYIGHTGAITSDELKDSLQHWGISYNHLSAGAQNVIDAVNDRNHIVICPVTMSYFSPGLDIDSTSDDPELHYDRYSSFSGGHFIIVKGISDDGNWIIVYDPNVWGNHPYPEYWYSNGEPKGKERYYKLSEFSNAINSRGIEILTEPHPIITSPLKITPSSPYCIGDTINAEFSITNKNSLPITFSVLTVGGRDPDNHVSDFTHRQNISLEPYESYNYQGTLSLNKVGNYHFFCTYQTPDGNWNTNVDLGSGLTDGDRVEDIVVIEREAEKEVVYVAEQSNERIQKFTSEGKFITKWGKRGSGDGEFDCPIRIAIDSQGNVYVADSYNHRIQKFTSEGKFITKWGNLGSSSGMLRSPQGIAIDSQDNIYVVDEGNDRIQKFTSEGKFIIQWGDYGSGHGFFKSPQGIAIDSEGNIYVADTDNYQIQKFTSEGKFIIQWGKEGIGDGEFDEPHGIAIDSQSNIYVADWHNHRIQKFTSEGKFILKWGKEGIGDGEFDCPTGIAISRIYDIEEIAEKEKEEPSIAPDISEELYIEWDKTFGGSENDVAWSIIQTSDGGYSVAGYTESKGKGERDFWIIKLDHQGNILWDKTFGGSKNDYAESIIQTKDGGYMVAGTCTTLSKNIRELDAWIIKLDERGNIEWDKTFGGSENDWAYSIIQTTDGGYAIAGETESKGAGEDDAWIIKLDHQGNKIWDKVYGGEKSDTAYSLIQTTDGGYAIAGSTESKGAGKNDAWIIKLDHQGNKIWDKVYGGEEYDYTTSLIQTSDGGYIVAGGNNSKGLGEVDAWIIKLDNRGNLEWDKIFGGNKYEWIVSLIQTIDGGYAIAGSTESKGAGKNDAWIIKLDYQGNKIWDKVYGGEEHDYAISFIQTSDGGYAIAGSTESKGAGKADIWVIKLNSGIIEALEEEVTEASSLKDYFPLDEGRRWEYQILLKEGGGWEGIFGPESESGKRIVTNFPQRELKGEKVTPKQVEDKIWGSSHISFWFYIEDQSGVYEFAYQNPEDIEPKIIHDYIIKYPIKVGNIWQEIETSSFKPKISIPVKSTIESINEVVTVPAGTFKGCLKIKTIGFAEKVIGSEWLPEEKVRIDREWYKWFAPGIGLIKSIFKEKKTWIKGIASPPVPEFREMTMQLEIFK